MAKLKIISHSSSAIRCTTLLLTLIAFNLSFQTLTTAATRSTDNEKSENQQLMYDWRVFKSKHGMQRRQMNSFVEEDRKFKLFSENWKKVAEHNKLADKDESSYRTGVNDFSVRSEAQLKDQGLLNGVPLGFEDGTQIYNITEEQAHKELSSLLVNLNSNSNNSNTRADRPEPRQKSFYSDQGPVKHQGNCGGCWSFAVTGVVETLHGLKDGHTQRLSEQQVIDCDRTNYGCNGGYPSRGFTYVRENGLVKEAFYPYKSKQEECFSNQQQGQARFKVRGNGKVPFGNEKYMKTLIAKVGPMAVAVDASHWGFLHYKSGIYDDPSCSSRGVTHAVMVLGYGVEHGKEYWLIKNSWGTTWGLRGYMKLARNKNNMCGVASLGSYAYL